MLLKEGDKIHVIARRMFETDLRRHFLGQVEAVTENAVRVAGYAFIWDSSKNQFIRRPEWRFRIISLTDSGNIINVLPQDVILEEVSYKFSKEKGLFITDYSESFSLDINEFGGKW